jgi:hypothetical protein
MFKSTSKLTIFLSLAFVAILLWPAVGLAQSSGPTTQLVTDPNDASRTFGETNNAVNAAAMGIPGSTEISAPSRGSERRREKMIVVDPAKEKERRQKENAFHDPTFDGTGLFADIKAAPTATPSAHESSLKSATFNSGGNFLGEPELSPIPKLSPSKQSSPAPVASPTPSPAKEQQESPTPSPSPSASPHDQQP